MLGCHKGSLSSVQHILFLGMKHRLDSRIVIEAVTQMLVDGFIHPVLGLLVTAIVKIAVLLDKYEILVYHIPYLLDAQAIET